MSEFSWHYVAANVGFYALRLVLAVVALWLGFLLSRYIQRRARRMVRRARPDDPIVLDVLFSRVIQVLTATLTIIVTLAILGINVSALLASLGFTSLILGFALKDTIEQAVSGTLLLLIRPFEIGELIEVEKTEGIVTDVGLRATELRTEDGIHVLIPNNKVYQSIIRNKSHYKARRHQVTTQFDPATTIGAAQRTMLDTLATIPEVATDPPPIVSVQSADEKMLTAVVYYWLPNSADTPEKHTTISRALTEAAQKAELRLIAWA